MLEPVAFQSTWLLSLLWFLPTGICPLSLPQPYPHPSLFASHWLLQQDFLICPWTAQSSRGPI